MVRIDVTLNVTLVECAPLTRNNAISVRSDGARRATNASNPMHVCAVHFQLSAEGRGGVGSAVSAGSMPGWTPDSFAGQCDRSKDLLQRDSERSHQIELHLFAEGRSRGPGHHAHLPNRNAQALTLTTQ